MNASSNAGVPGPKVPHADVKNRRREQFFGETYGETVRVVQIGGRAGSWNGYSMNSAAAPTRARRRDLACSASPRECHRRRRTPHERSQLEAYDLANQQCS